MASTAIKVDNRWEGADGLFVIHVDEGLDQRRCNAPAAPEVAGVHNISDLSAAYMPLHFPLLFPRGEPGWHPGILPRDAPAVMAGDRGAAPDQRTTVTPKEFAAFHLHARPAGIGSDHLLRGTRLLQEYIIDSYCVMEGNDLRYLQNHQRDIRAECYQGFPNWPDITAQLLPGQAAVDRPDVVARVFKLMVVAALEDLLDRQVLGTVVGHTYAIEWQKRGLPHMHLLLIFYDAAQPRSADDCDAIVCAELPNPNTEPSLYATITQCMMHGPCGVHHHDAPCMKDGRCSKHYPREFQEATTDAEGGYPVYRWPSRQRVHFHPDADLQQVAAAPPQTMLTAWMAKNREDPAAHGVLLLKDLMHSATPFGGKVVLLGGDFRQVLPVVPKGEGIVSLSADCCERDDDSALYVTEYLNSLSPSGLPPHKLVLKILDRVGRTYPGLRLARRGGVKRMTAEVYGDSRSALIAFLRPILHDVVVLVEHGRRFTVTVPDVLLALKRKGRTLFGFGEAMPELREAAALLRRRPTAAARKAATEVLAAEERASAAALGATPAGGAPAERDDGAADACVGDLPDGVYDRLQNALSDFRFSPDNRFRSVFKVDALMAGVAAQLPHEARVLCTRRSLRHVLLALQEERNALTLDGDDVYFCC
ncbi:hypothetical protein WJX81_004658 [Elliptochloris bilobata]|uniref:Multifunctional fusion protein n=1 Tax=Elliptochloris bilobata TaxID=381761 RepID=A0AAW1RCW9_9CHLO